MLLRGGSGRVLEKKLLAPTRSAFVRAKTCSRCRGKTSAFGSLEGRSELCKWACVWGSRS